MILLCASDAYICWFFQHILQLLIYLLESADCGEWEKH